MELSFLTLSLSLAVFLGSFSSPLRAGASQSYLAVNTLYSYQIKHADGKYTSLASFVNALSNKDVILIGEWHTHPGVHRFQAEFLAQFIAQNPLNKLALSMEQFARSKQDIINQYLSDQIGEHSFIKQSNAWPNYRSDYRPLIEIAKANQLEVIAANTTSQIIACLARQGISCLNSLSSKERKFVAKRLSTEDSAYKEKFFNSMHHGKNTAKQVDKEKQYLAQTAWDDTMAESIVTYLNHKPDSQVIHLAGAFHVEDGLGIASRIKALKPSLSIAIISPSTKDEAKKNTQDHQLIVQPLPKQWLNEQEMMKAFTKLPDQSAKKNQANK